MTEKSCDFQDFDSFWLDYSTRFLNTEASASLVFRGAADSEYDLKPSIGRTTEKHAKNGIETLERLIMDEFKRLAAAELDKTPETDWEWLFLAQHYGLPTRLLDWSTNPLVALYFAIEQYDDKDGLIYYTQASIQDKYELFSPYTANYVNPPKMSTVRHLGNALFVRPKYTDRRYLNQQSVFACSPNPFEPLNMEGLQKITFSRKLKPKLRRVLRTLGVSTSFIYPGIGGIAADAKNSQFDLIKDESINAFYLMTYAK
ncbi:FRG domain-containing protein [Hydrogenovibrio sp. 3SP14C1]|uniref:FRG domain-containing protein n=1 Tax=Hydrogenovibrio sp. 3SP14C1 TaxID=3038774 RepID=UPI002416D5B9|nr:FRG domain-containing protein [Hydrogenovibrio sp. 3SP14C1]MDG4812640.1 FRG domain-containing protein [Hydrogenovibrio sp. 3SP14C1]